MKIEVRRNSLLLPNTLSKPVVKETENLVFNQDQLQDLQLELAKHTGPEKLRHVLSTCTPDLINNIQKIVQQQGSSLSLKSIAENVHGPATQEEKNEVAQTILDFCYLLQTQSPSIDSLFQTQADLLNHNVLNRSSEQIDQFYTHLLSEQEHFTLVAKFFEEKSRADDDLSNSPFTLLSQLFTEVSKYPDEIFRQSQKELINFSKVAIKSDSASFFEFVFSQAQSGSNISPAKAMALLVDLIPKQPLKQLLSSFKTPEQQLDALVTVISKKDFYSHPSPALNILFTTLCKELSISDTLNAFLGLTLDAATQQEIKKSPVIQACNELMESLTRVTIQAGSSATRSPSRAPLLTLRYRQLHRLMAYTVTSCSQQTTRHIFTSVLATGGNALAAKLFGGAMYQILKPLLGEDYRHAILASLKPKVESLTVKTTPLLTVKTTPLLDTKEKAQEVLSAALMEYQASKAHQPVDVQSKAITKEQALSQSAHVLSPVLSALSISDPNTPSVTTLMDLSQLLVLIKRAHPHNFREILIAALKNANEAPTYTPEQLKKTSPTVASVRQSSLTIASLIEELNAELSMIETKITHMEDLSPQNAAKAPSSPEHSLDPTTIITESLPLLQAVRLLSLEAMEATRIDPDGTRPEDPEGQLTSVVRLGPPTSKVPLALIETLNRLLNKLKSPHKVITSPTTSGEGDDAVVHENIISKATFDEPSRIEDLLFYKFPRLLSSILHGVFKSIETMDLEDPPPNTNALLQYLNKIQQQQQQHQQLQEHLSRRLHQPQSDPLRDSLCDPAFVTLLLSAYFELIALK